MDPEALVAAVRGALAAPVGGTASRVPAALATPGALRLLLVDGLALPAVALALPPLMRALGGATPRRPLVVAACEDGERPSRAELARILEPAIPGATFVAHDPDGAHHFRPGRTAAGVPIELDDVLLEAEALLTVGPVRRVGGSVMGGAGLVFPGLASRRMRASWAADTADRERAAEEVRAQVPVDFQLCWRECADGSVTAWAGAGRSAETAARRAAAREP